ncbi:MAG: PEGA domain-containing protein [Deltaproteobacteria bacterium]|nr:PEGA domain-containing protein [Deltaproteobacteria bacterium]
MLTLAATASASTAAAGTLAEALTQHRDADVTELRAQLRDVAARCTLGAVYARRGDVSRAALYLTDCDEAALPAEVSADIAKAVVAVRKQIGASELAKVEIVSTPEGMSVQFDGLPGEAITTPQTAWIKAGTYELRGSLDGKTFTTVVNVRANGRASAYLDTRSGAAPKSATEPRDRKVDFVEEFHEETQHKGQPPDVKHPKLTANSRWDGTVAVLVQEEQLEDPFATQRRITGYGPPRATWLGLRVGAGMFDDGATPARPGFAFGLAARHALSPRQFASGRLDYSTRGGDAGGDAIGVVGASAGLGTTLVTTPSAAVAVLGQLRGDLRFGDARHMDPIRRTGASVAAGLEIALSSTPITTGLRFEQGLTTLVADTRDRALLLEIGVDWR